MTTLAFVADVHVGNHSVFGGPVVASLNGRCRSVLKALAQAATIARERADVLVIAGDLFDTSTPLPQAIAEVQRILEPVPQVVVLQGNHDLVSDSPGDHALGPLEALPNVIVATAPMAVRVGDTALLCVPFRVGDAREWFADAVEEAAADPVSTGAAHRVLAFHLGVIDNTTPAYLAGAHDAVSLGAVQAAMERHGIEAGFCGNWHAGKRWAWDDRVLVQIGATAPTGFDNPGFDVGLLRLYATRGLGAPAGPGAPETVVLDGPRFVTATTLEEVDRARRLAQGRELFVSLKGEAAKQLDAVRALPDVVGVRAVSDQSEARAATRAAAVAVRQASTLDEALAAFVKQMPLGEGVERETVLAAAKAYLSKGAK